MQPQLGRGHGADRLGEPLGAQRAVPAPRAVRDDGVSAAGVEVEVDAVPPLRRLEALDQALRVRGRLAVPVAVPHLRGGEGVE